MDAPHRKILGVIGKYAEESFSEGDWYTLGQLAGQLDYVQSHPRLLRSLSFGDEDYASCVAQVLDHIAEEEPDAVNEIIDHFDIDLWYEQKHPDKLPGTAYGHARKSSWNTSLTLQQRHGKYLNRVTFGV